MELKSKILKEGLLVLFSSSFLFSSILNMLYLVSWADGTAFSSLVATIHKDYNYWDHEEVCFFFLLFPLLNSPLLSSPLSYPLFF